MNIPRLSENSYQSFKVRYNIIDLSVINYSRYSYTEDVEVIEIQNGIELIELGDV